MYVVCNLRSLFEADLFSDFQRRAVNLSQPALENVLRSHLAKNGVNIEYGVELIGIEQEEQGEYVLAKVKVGGKEVEEKFSYIISADGGRGVCARRNKRDQYIDDLHSFIHSNLRVYTQTSRDSIPWRKSRRFSPHGQHRV